MQVAGAYQRQGSIADQYRFTLDDLNGAFTLQPSSQKAPEIIGVFLPKARRFAAELQGRQWDKCSSAIIFPEKLREKIEDQLTEAPSTASSFFGRTPLGKMINSVSAVSQNKQSCAEETQQWLKQFIASLPPQLDRRTDLKPYISAMYEDAVFEPAFGDPIREFSLQNGQVLLARKISNASHCGLARQEAMKYQQAITQLVSPLSNHAQFSRNAALITNLAKPIYQTWLVSLREQLDQSARISAEDPQDHLTRLDKLQPWTERAQQAIQPAAASGLPKAIEERRQQLYGQLVRNRLESQMTNTHADMQSLETLARFSQAQQREFAYLTTQDKTEIEDAINQKINALAPQAIQQMVERSGGLSGYKLLNSWEARFAAVSQRLSDPIHQTGKLSVERRQEVLAQTILADYRKTYQQEVASNPLGKTALAAGVIFEKRVNAELQPLIHLADTQAFAGKRAARRARDLQAADKDLSRLIAGQPHLTALDQLKETYLLPEDQQNPSAKHLLAAIATRKSQVAPFDHLQGGDYLNALYSGDFSQVDELDDSFIKPYTQGLFKESMDHMTPIMDGFAKLAGYNINTKRAMEKSMETASLIVPVFAIYLVDYQTRYKYCLEPDAIPFTITTSSETVYRDGYGTYQYSVPHPDQVEHFLVNRRFAHVFKAVGLSNPDSPLGHLVDNMFGGNGRINISDIGSGTRQMMAGFKCNSPTIKQMENNMLKFFDQYLVNRKQVNEALFN